MFRSNDKLILLSIILFAVGLTAMLFVKSWEKQAVDPEIVEISNQSSSDELDSIEADLNETELDYLDQEVLGIQAQLEE